MEVLLRNHFVPGQSLRYRGSTQVHQEVKQSGVTTDQQDHSWDAILVQRVIAVDEDGAGHVVSLAVPEYPDASAIEGALEAQHQVTYVLIDPLGHVRLASTATPPSTYSFPNRLVFPGATWEGTSQFALPPNGQIAHVTFKYTLREFQEIEGRACAILDVTAPGSEWEVLLPDNPEPALVMVETHGVICFDYVNGILVRSEMETQTSPHHGNQSVTTVTRTVQDLLSEN